MNREEFERRAARLRGISFSGEASNVCISPIAPIAEWPKQPKNTVLEDPNVCIRPIAPIAPTPPEPVKVHPVIERALKIVNWQLEAEESMPPAPPKPGVYKPTPLQIVPEPPPGLTAKERIAYYDEDLHRAFEGDGESEVIHTPRTLADELLRMHRAGPSPEDRQFYASILQAFNGTYAPSPPNT